MTVFRGIPDSKLGEILTQKGLTQAVKMDGGLDYQWIRDHMREVQDAIINTTFADNGFTSTTTEKHFAKYWGQHKNKNENLMRLAQIPDEDKTKEQKDEYARWTSSDAEQNNVSGGHVIKMSLPAGSRAAPVSAAAKDKDADFLKMQEVLVDKGSLFKITGFDVNNDEDAGPDSFNLMMELVNDEENMEPTGNAVENPVQLNHGVDNNNLINGNHNIENIDDEADNHAMTGEQDAELLNRAFIMKKRKKKKKKKH